jgi:CBS domain-containing protein
MQVGDMMTKDVKTAGADASFADAARILQDNRISSVIITEGNRVAGIVTERDLVNVVADGLDPSAVKVGERMTRELATVDPRTDIADAAQLMADRRIRHLPVMDKGSLAGVISIRDLTDWAVEEMTGGHELPDLERSRAALAAHAEIKRSQ